MDRREFLKRVPLFGGLVLTGEAVNTTPLTVKTSKGKTALVARTEGDDGNQLNLFPPVADGRVTLSMFTAPEGEPSARALSIQVHGSNDPYDPTHKHVSVYTQDARGNFIHVMDWEWGDHFDGVLRIPSMDLEVQGKITAKGGIVNG